MMKCGRLAILVMTLLLLSGFASASGVRYNPKPGDKFSIISLEGTLEMGDDIGLRQILSEAKQRGLPIMVVLSGDGSLAKVALNVGETIREFGAITKARSCAGVCVLAFLGGVNRIYPRTNNGGALVVYRPEGLDALMPDDGNAMSLLAPQGELKNVFDYIVKMTGKPDFYYMLVNVSYTRPYTLLVEEAKKMNVVTYVPK